MRRQACERMFAMAIFRLDFANATLLVPKSTQNRCATPTRSLARLEVGLTGRVVVGR
jgi:hypothetical protein